MLKLIAQKFLYVLLCIVFVVIACPIVYAIFMLFVVFFGNIFGGDDFFMWWFS